MTTNRYKDSGDANAIMDPMGIETHLENDKAGRRVSLVEDSDFPMILDRVGRVRQSEPDANGAWGGRLELEWDAWSRIVAVKSDTALVGTYTYDGLHRRVTRQVSGATWHSYYSDAWRPLEERKNAETTAAMSYLWGARHRDDLVRRDRAVGGTTLNETRYVLTDYFSAAAIADEDGEIKERYAYSAFGVRRIISPEFTMRTTSECAFEFGFQGQFLDVESGLMNYGYRSYSPYLGRWMCKDPIAEEGGYNLYGFAGNKPVDFVDHLGLLVCCPPGQSEDAYGKCCSECKMYEDFTGQQKCGVAGSCGDDDEEIVPVSLVPGKRKNCLDLLFEIFKSNGFDDKTSKSLAEKVVKYGAMAWKESFDGRAKREVGLTVDKEGNVSDRSYSEWGQVFGNNRPEPSGGSSFRLHTHPWSAGPFSPGNDRAGPSPGDINTATGKIPGIAPAHEGFYGMNKNGTLGIGVINPTTGNVEYCDV